MELLTVSTLAFAGAAALTILAPFERLEPLVRLPGQSVSNLEAAILAAFAAWGVQLVASRRWPEWRTPLTAPWLVLVGALLLSALTSSIATANALHMTGRLAAAFGIFLLVVNGVATRRRIRLVVTLALATAVAVSVLTILEYLKVRPVLDWLKAFRPFVNTVGALVRAGGPLQYPTIASMYLEVVFALGLGLMLWALDERRAGFAVAVFMALLVVADAITLTFTRAGLVTMTVSLTVVAMLRYRTRGVEVGAAALALLAVGIVALFIVSRSASVLWLRFSSEGQEAWYRMRVDPPASLRFATDETQAVPVALTNTGRVTWDSDDPSPFFLSYHWMPPDGDRYVTFEGIRTRFADPVAPGEAVTIRALVRAPRAAGRYRLVWDVVQERRLWFSTEPGAEPSISWATVDGASATAPVPTTAAPKRTVRPGRATLWKAALAMFAEHPVLGVGPDNVRLAYGAYAGLRGADPRTHSNNMYLEILAGGGLVGAIAFAWFLQRAFRIVSSTTTDEETRMLGAAMTAACLAIALHGLVDSFLSFAPTYVLFSLTLGLAAALVRATEPDAHRV